MEEINEPVGINYNEIEVDNFDDILCEHEDVLRGVYEYGFTEVSRVQSKTLQPIIDGVDTIVQSPAGTGKTAAYLVGGLVKIEASCKYPQMLIVGNTKELADQIYKIAKHLSVHMGISISLCIGGTANLDVMRNLDQARISQILVGTPGRLVDLIKRDMRKDTKFKLLDRLKLLVLDEADKLLDDDFVEDIKAIVRNKSEDSQICLFSATYPRRILDMTQQFMKNPVTIKIERDKLSLDKIKHYYVDVEYNEYKYGVIVDIYQNVSICQAIIYVNSTRTANELAQKLKDDGFPVGVTHAELDDNTRIETLKRFRLGQIRLLVGTDLISRGMDIKDVGLVINYDIPRKPDIYIHRAGRTARNGKLGVAITMVTNHESDNRQMAKIESVFKVKFITLPPLDNVSNFLVGKNGYNFGGGSV
jgi:translation initiation factor 4A